MFIVSFKLHCKPESRLEVSQSLQGIVAKVKKLDGCKDTQVYEAADDENIFFLVEEWRGQRNLDDHMKSNLFAALLGFEELLVKSLEIKFMVEN